MPTCGNNQPNAVSGFVGECVGFEYEYDLVAMAQNFY